jgi:protease II
MSAPQASSGTAHWIEVVPQEAGHYLSHFEAFETFVAVDIESESGTKIRVFSLPDGREIPVPLPSGLGVASSSFVNDNEGNLEPAATVLRFRSSGPLQPECIYDFDVSQGTLNPRRKDPANRWFDRNQYAVDRNTFTDFITATETLIAQGYADPQAVFAQGGSAGGLLMGAIANLRPDLYAGIVAEAPFVDVVTTMSDTSLPLTTLEYEEWGNPTVERDYKYMLSYSPYDNVARQSYPAMFVTAGFYDIQVSYAEPAKWVARLRASKRDAHDLLLRTDMSSGHEGRSGRAGFAEESAAIMGWLIGHTRYE